MQPEWAQGAPGTGPPVRILIIDDHEVSRAALRALLQTEGFHVAELGSGDDLVAAVVAFGPAVAVVDVTPGQPAGFGIARRLGKLARPPVVVLTSSAGRRSFGSRLDGQLFVAKADLCAAAIRRQIEAADGTARPAAPAT